MAFAAKYSELHWLNACVLESRLCGWRWVVEYISTHPYLFVVFREGDYWSCKNYVCFPTMSVAIWSLICSTMYFSVFWTTLRQVNFYVCVPGFGWCTRWAQGLYWFEQNILTSSHRWLELPTSFLIHTHIRGYKRAREGGEAPKSLCGGEGRARGYKVES
jgi:hypothetical protein